MILRNQGPRAARFELLFLVGVGHCGSTLLGSLLHGHPRIACVGEMARIGDALIHGRPCSCGAPIDSCPFWAPLLPGLRDGGKLDQRFTLADYAHVRRACGADVLLDTSKSILVRMAERWFSPWKSARVGYVFLVRDSRGVLATAVRERKELAPRLRKHEKWMNRLARFIEGQGERALTVHYEDLCHASEHELRRVCGWAGLEFDPGMLRPADHEHHFVHANTMRYLGRTNEIRLDQRWRDELDAATVARIEEVMARVPLLRRRYLEPARAQPGGFSERQGSSPDTSISAGPSNTAGESTARNTTGRSETL